MKKKMTRLLHIRSYNIRIINHNSWRPTRSLRNKIEAMKMKLVRKIKDAKISEIRNGGIRNTTNNKYHEQNWDIKKFVWARSESERGQIC